MKTRAVRGAISVDDNTPSALKEAVKELVGEMLKANSIETEDISHAIFTLTKDLNAGFPAKYARELFDWQYVPMMCYNELDVPNSLPKCLRVMIVVNTDKAQKEIKHIYLKEASSLRQDLVR